MQNNTLPIGNGKLLDLTDAAACRDFFNQIVANIDLEDANLDVAQKIKVVINEVYKGVETYYSQKQLLITKHV